MINEALEHDSHEEFYQALINPSLGLGDYIDSFAVPLYYTEMKIDRAESKVYIFKEGVPLHFQTIEILRLFWILLNATKI